MAAGITLDSISIEYADLTKVFSKEEASILALHYNHNYIIKL